MRDFPGGPVAKTLYSQCRGTRCNPWPWTEEPGGLQSKGSQRAGHDWSDWACTPKELDPICSQINEQIYVIFNKKKEIDELEILKCRGYFSVLMGLITQNMCGAWGPIRARAHDDRDHEWLPSLSSGKAALLDSGVEGLLAHTPGRLQQPSLVVLRLASQLLLQGRAVHEP